MSGPPVNGSGPPAIFDLVQGYLSLGWAVIALHTPGADGRCSCSKGAECGSPGKHPRFHPKDLVNGPHSHTTDLDLAARWWGRWPKANIGIATGAASGIVALDIDGDLGKATFRKLVGEHAGHYPATVRQRTGGGGEQWIFEYVPGLANEVRIAPGLDVRTDGGLIVAPGSLHASGRYYEWVAGYSPSELEPAAMPEWLIGTIRRAGAGQRREPLPEGAPIAQGQRNDVFFRMGCAMRRWGAGEAAILAALTRENESRCQPPLPVTELAHIARSAVRYNPTQKLGASSADPEPPEAPAGPHCTDTGNASRFAGQHHAVVRFNGAMGWLVYDGKRWRRDEAQQVVEFAKQTALSIYGEAGEAATKEERRDLADWAKKSESYVRIQAMLSLAESVPSLFVPASRFDADPWLLNCDNGTIDLRSGELRRHNAEDYCSRLVPVRYDPQARCANWRRFLVRVFGGNRALIRYIQRAVGYSLTGLVIEQVLFFLHGLGCNGKTTLLRVLLALLGDYAMQAPPGLLLESKSDRHPTERADLAGKRLVVSVEVGEGKRLAEELVKSLTGDDKVKGRFMRQDFFEFDPLFKLWLAANHKPTIRGTDHAIWRRIPLVPFGSTFEDEPTDPRFKKDRHLLEKLLAELPGILAWAVRGCLAWQREGLNAPQAVRAATAAYRAEMDTIGDFLGDCCVLEAGRKASAQSLYQQYRQWCELTGEHPVKQKTFGDRLRERGCESIQVGALRVRHWKGIGLLAPDEPPGRTDQGGRTDQNADSRITPRNLPHESLIPEHAFRSVHPSDPFTSAAEAVAEEEDEARILAGQLKCGRCGIWAATEQMQPDPEAQSAGKPRCRDRGPCDNRTELPKMVAAWAEKK